MCTYLTPVHKDFPNYLNWCCKCEPRSAIKFVKAAYSYRLNASNSSKFFGNITKNESRKWYWGQNKQI